ncbi:hypothetical protein BGX38DRAFT_97428 [Terfezia claveryi]|nr:hypothetical protein BGX38DRAFT_97428 [Terfezia claveryi]
MFSYFLIPDFACTLLLPSIHITHHTFITLTFLLLLGMRSIFRGGLHQGVYGVAFLVSLFFSLLLMSSPLSTPFWALVRSVIHPLVKVTYFDNCMFGVCCFTVPMLK